MSKTKIVIRKLNSIDDACLGKIPAIFIENAINEMVETRTGQKPKKEVKLEDLKAEDFEYVIQRCVRAIVRVVDEGPQIVGKKPSECTASEFSIYDLEDMDLTYLIEQVNGEEGREFPATFQEAPGK